MKKLVLLVLGFMNVAMLLCTAHAEKMKGSMVYFRSGDTTLSGYVYRPEGTGPFPAVVYVRPINKPITESNPPAPDLGKFYTSKGFVLFIPMHRTAEDLKAEINGGQVKGKNNKKFSLPEYTLMTKDIAAAVTWIKSQSYVNENRVAVSGQGSGAVGSLLLSQQEVEVSGYIVFSPGVQAWNEKVQLREALVNAVREAKAPIFLIQPQNDYNLLPSERIGKELSTKPQPNLAKVYPPFGNTHQEANAFSSTGSDVWGPDVMKFLGTVFNL